MFITEINRCNIVDKKSNLLKKSKTQIVDISSPCVTSYLCRLLNQTETTDIPFTFKQRSTPYLGYVRDKCESVTLSSYIAFADIETYYKSRFSKFY